MSEGLLFGLGSVLFIFVSAAIPMFGYARFQATYLRDQISGDDALKASPETVASAVANGDGA